MSTPAQRLKAARAIHLSREGAPTAGDRWFSLYLIGFVTGFYILPVVYVIGDYLDPDFAQHITRAETEPFIAAGLTVLGVAALWAGRIQGPVFLTPFLAHTLLGTDIPRRRVLLLPTLKAVVSAGTTAAGLGAVGAFALTLTGVWGWDRFGLLVAAAFAGGVQLGLLAFLGQRLNRKALLLTSGTILSLSAAALLLPPLQLILPAGWAASLWAGRSAWLLLPLLLSSAGAAVLLITHRTALDRLPADRVLSQSRRLSEARLFTSTGSINDAVELFRSKPAHRFHRVPVTAGPAVISGLRQELTCALRSPLALLGAALLIPAGAALLTLAAPAAGASFQDSNLLTTVPLGVTGAVLLFLGTGGLSEGWRQLKNEFDAAALFGWSPAAALSRRLLWPVLTSGVLTAAGAAGVVVLTSGAQWTQLAWALAVAAAALAARFFQSMRSRDIPVEFLAPTVIPGGFDLSAVKIMLWLGDGIIITVTAALTVLVLPWQPSTLTAVLGCLILVTMMWGWARTGVQMTAGPPRPA